MCIRDSDRIAGHGHIAAGCVPERVTAASAVKRALLLVDANYMSNGGWRVPERSLEGLLHSRSPRSARLRRRQRSCRQSRRRRLLVHRRVSTRRSTAGRKREWATTALVVVLFLALAYLVARGLLGGR